MVPIRCCRRRLRRLAFLQMLLLGVAVVNAEPRSCSICHDASEPAEPDSRIWLPGLNTIGSISCRDVDRFAGAVLPEASSAACQSFYRFGSVCGCPPVVLPASDSCGGLCSTGVSIDSNRSSVVLPQFGTVFPTLSEIWYTCQLMDAFLVGTHKNDTFCRTARSSAAETCGCPPVTTSDELWNATNATTNEVDLTGDGFFADVTSLWIGLLGSKGPSQLRRLHRLSRFAALCSVLGSMLVLQDCLRHVQRRSHVYNQIVGVMASYDIVHSIAIGLQQLPRPKNGFLQYPNDGQLGTEATCTAQGWFIQWGGMTSLFLNGALSTYYVLVIVYSTKEVRLKALRKWMIGPPMIAGVIIACASLPFIGLSYLGGCFIIPPYPEFSDVDHLPGSSNRWGSFIGLFLLPGWLVVLYSTMALVWVWLHVRKVTARAKRWVFPNSTGPPTSLTSHTMSVFRRSSRRRPEIERLEQTVAWQCAMYLLALYFSWVLSLVIATNLDDYRTSHYRLWTFFFVVSPLQGLLNSANYFGPRLARLFREYRRGRQQRRSNETPQHEQSPPSGFFRDWMIASSVEPANQLANIVSDDNDDASVVGAEESKHSEPVSSGDSRGKSGSDGVKDDGEVYSVTWKDVLAVEPANELVRWNNEVEECSSTLVKESSTEDTHLEVGHEMESALETNEEIPDAVESTSGFRRFYL